MLYNEKKFIIFIFTGGIAAFVNIMSRLLISIFISYEYAIILAYIIGMVTAYILNRSFVFASKGIRLRKSIPVFILVNLFALSQTWITSMILSNKLLPLLNITSNKDFYAHIIGVCVPIFSSYYGHKHITFKE